MLNPKSAAVTPQYVVHGPGAGEIFSERLNRRVHMADGWLVLVSIMLGLFYYKFTSTAPLPGDYRVDVLSGMLVAFVWFGFALWFVRLFLYLTTYDRMVPYHYVTLTLNALVVLATFVACADLKLNLF